MDREVMYARRDTAGRMNAIMLIVAGIALLAAILALLRYGWLPCAGFLILGAIAFGLSQVFDLLGELFAPTDRSSKRTAPEASERAQQEI